MEKRKWDAKVNIKKVGMHRSVNADILGINESTTRQTTMKWNDQEATWPYQGLEYPMMMMMMVSSYCSQLSGHRSWYAPLLP